MTTCSTCYTATFDECDDIVLPGLIAGTDYEITVSDKFGTEYSFEATADGDGDILIITNPTDGDYEDLGFPSFFFNRNAGSFTFIAEEVVSLYEREPVAFEILDVEYDCIIVTIT